MRVVGGILVVFALMALPAVSGAADRSYQIQLAQAQDTPSGPADSQPNGPPPPPADNPTPPPPPQDQVQPGPAPGPAPGPTTPPPMPAPTPPPLPAPAPTPPPLPPKPVVTFYIEQNGQAVGPLTLEQVGAEITARHVTQKTLVWKSGDPAWVTADQQADLAVFLKAIPPTIPTNVWDQFILGTWQADIQTTQGGQMFGQLLTTQFRADNSFVGVVAYSINGAPSGNTPLSGTWKVTGLTEDTFTLTENVPGQQPVTVTLKRLDQNTVANEAEGYQARRIAN